LAVCFRPQRLTWADENPEDSLSVPVTVNVVEKIGTEDIVRCTTPEGHDVTAEVNSGALVEGMDGYLAFDHTSLHLFDGVTEDAERLN